MRWSVGYERLLKSVLFKLIKIKSPILFLVAREAEQGGHQKSFVPQNITTEI